MRFNKLPLLTLMTLSIVGFSSVTNTTAMAAPNSTVSTEFEKFTPRPSSNSKLDFELMDLLLERSVLFTGPSLRKTARKLEAYTGTHLVRKHTSAYRLEGNKVVYSLFSPLHKRVISDYLKDLESLPSDIDFTALSRNDQLAYWFNLHNLALINTISNFYPTHFPKDIKPIEGSDVHLHDAKILMVNGVPLSLRDIREKIVYPNWSDPIVVYGFHDGTLGSPSIPAIAFKRGNLRQTLKTNALEFTNSLRGFQRGKVSSFYKEVAPYYFVDFDKDIRAHLKKYMRDSVYAELEETQKLQFHRDIDIIADTTGGYGKYATPQNLYLNGQSGDIGIPPSVAEYIQERNFKMERLVDEGLFSYGTVTIEDIETTDEPTNIK